MKQKLLVIALTLILFLVFAVPAFAQGPDGGGRVIFGSDFTLESGETISGDVVVFGGRVEIAEDSRISGDLAAIGGNIKIEGRVNGDVAALGGNINVGESANVDGDIVLFGGKADVAEGAQVTGDIVNLTEGGFHDGFSFSIPDAPPVPDVPRAPEPPRAGFENFSYRALDFLRDLAWNIAVIIGLAAVSWLVATFMPEQMKLVGDTVAESGPLSFGLGFLTLVVSIVIGIPLIITICLAFVPILAYILIGIAVLFGWIAIGQLIGERLLSAAGQPYPNFAISAVVGVVVMTIAVNMPVLSWIPCLGFVLGFLGGLAGAIISLTGLGAVLLTRFGTRPYTPQPSYPMSPGPVPADTDFSDLDVNSASEAELKARIKEALAEADQEPEPEPEPEEPAGDQPEDDPDQTPNTGA